MLDHKSKVDAFNSIMKHPKLSKILGDAFDAPIGSTKRTQALAILDSLDKIYKKKFKEDGQGGPTSVVPKWGPGSQSSNVNYLPYTPQNTSQYGNLMILPAAPPMIDSTVDQQRGPMTSISGQQKGAMTKFIPPSPIPPQRGSMTSISGQQRGAMTPMSPEQKSEIRQRQGMTPMSPEQKSEIKQRRGISPMSPEQKSEIKAVSMQQEMANEYYSYAISKGFSPEEASQLAVEHSGVQPTMQPAPTPSIEKEKIQPLDELAIKEPGPESFTMNVRNLPIEEIRKLFPGVADKDLPMRGNIGEQLGKLSETLKKEKDLKFWEDKLKEQAEKGMTLIPDTEAYIREKDEYIKNIDKMILDAEERLIPISNPERKKEMIDYIDYLNTLKGRHNQGYTAYLNANIEAYDKEMNRINKEYEKVRNDYNEEFQRQQIVTTEKYNIWSKVLEERWKYVHDANDPEKILDWNAKISALQKNQEDIINSVLDALKSDKDYSKEQKNYKEQFVDPKGILLPTVDIADEIDRLLKLGNNPEGLINQAERGLKATMYTYKDDPSQLYEEIKKRSGQLFKLIDNKDIPNSVGHMQRMISEIYNTSEQPIKDYLTDNSEKLMEAVKDLTPLDWLGKSKTPTGKEEWVKKYSSTFNKKLLNDMYDAYENIKNSLYTDDPGKVRGMFTGFDDNDKPIKKIDSTNINIIIDKIYEMIKKNDTRWFGMS